MFTWFWGAFSRIRETKAEFPEQFILGTEACFESFKFLPPFVSGPVLGSWHRGEVYAYDIINDLNAGVSGWTDWNLVLDLQGGPNWAHNFVDSPILVDPQNKVYYQQPMFFFLGHFSKFLIPQSQRLQVTSSNFKLPFGFGLHITAFLRPDNFLVITLLNMGFWRKNFLFRLAPNRFFNYSIPKHTIQTIFIKL